MALLQLCYCNTQYFFQRIIQHIVQHVFYGCWLCIGVLIAASQMFAQQFVVSNGPFQGEVRAIAEHQGVFIAAIANIANPQSTNHGLYRSTNQGEMWERVWQTPEASVIRSVLSTPSGLFIISNPIEGGSGRVYHSYSLGALFESIEVLQGCTHIINAGAITSTTSSTMPSRGVDTLIARTESASGSILHVSMNGGQTWIPIQQSRNTINSLVSWRSPSQSASATILFGGSNGLGLLRSTDKGLTWQEVQVSGTNKDFLVYALCSGDGDNTDVYLSTNHGVFRSTDGGMRWTAINIGLEHLIATGVPVRSLVLFKGALYAGTAKACFRYSGTAWNMLAEPFAGEKLREENEEEPQNEIENQSTEHCYHSEDNRFLILGTRHGIVRLNGGIDSTLEWEAINKGLPSEAFGENSLATLGGKIFAASVNNVLYRSIEQRNALAWHSIRIPGIQATHPNKQKGVTPRICTTARGGLLLASGKQVFISQDSGRTWKAVVLPLSSNEECTAVGAVGEALFAGMQDGVIFKSEDNGTTWYRSQTTFSAPIQCFFAIQTKMFAGTGAGLAESADGGATWSLLASPRFPRMVSVFAGLVAGSQMAVVGTRSGIFRSVNNGETWFTSRENTRIGEIHALLERSGVLYASAPAQGIMRSTDNASSWVRVDEKIEQGFVVLAANARTIATAGEHGILTADAPSDQQPRFPIIRVLSVDSAIVGSPGITITVYGNYFTPTSRVQFGDVPLQVNFINSSELLVLIPRHLLLSAGEVLLEIINSNNPGDQSGAGNAQFRASTIVRIVEAPRTLPLVLASVPDSLFVNEQARVVLLGRNLSGARILIQAAHAEELRPENTSDTSITILLPARLVTQTGEIHFEIIQPATNERSTFRVRVVLRPEVPIQIAIQQSNFSLFHAYFSFPSESQYALLEAQRVVDSLKITAPLFFQVSLNDRDWFDSLALFPNPDSAISARRLYVRFFPHQNAVSLVNERYERRIRIESARGTTIATLSVSGNIIPLEVNINPEQILNFGRVRAGSATAASIRFHNTSPLPAQFFLSITGANAAGFRLEQRVVQIAPGEIQTLSVEFRPRSTGAAIGENYAAELQIVGARTLSVRLEGAIGAAIFAFSRQEIVFSTSAYVGQRRDLPEEKVVLHNTGDMDDIVTEIPSDIGGIIRVLASFPFVLHAQSSTTLTLQLKPEEEAIMLQRGGAPLSSSDTTSFRLQTQLSVRSEHSSTGSTLRVQGLARILLPPILRSPAEAALSVSELADCRFAWEPVLGATHYELALSESPAAPPRSVIAITTLSSVSLALPGNRTYYWSVRSLRLAKQQMQSPSGGGGSAMDTLVISSWQTRQFFFDTAINIPLETALRTTLDFGTVPLEQGSAAKAYTITADREALRVDSVKIADDNDAVFSLHPGDLRRLESFPLTAITRFPLRVLFSPKTARIDAPYTALMLVYFSHGVVLPVRLLARTAACNTFAYSCQQTPFTLVLEPQGKKYFFPGDSVRLQLRSGEEGGIAPALEQYFHRLRVRLFVENVSLVSFPALVVTGTPSNPIQRVEFTPYPGQNNGEISIDVQRPFVGFPPNALIAEMHGIATIGLRQGLSSNGGTGAGGEEHLDSAYIGISSVEWLPNDGTPLGYPISGVIFPNYLDEHCRFIVNTCADSVSSLFLTQTKPLSLSIRPSTPVQQASGMEIVYSVQERAYLELQLFNTAGQHQATFLRGQYEPGEYSLHIDTQQIPSGVYILVLKTPHRFIQHKMEVVK